MAGGVSTQYDSRVKSADAEARERFQTALELTDLAERMLRQRLRREQPELTDAEIDAKIDGWYEDRPGAPHGDASGEPSGWPRRG